MNTNIAIPGQRLCEKIEENLAEINVFPIKKSFDSDSFKLIYQYGKGRLDIVGEMLDKKLKRTVKISNIQQGKFQGNLIFSKANFIQKCIFDALRLIFADDDLPRCPECGIRPSRYLEYETHIDEIDVEASGLPILNVINFQGPLCENIKKPTFVVAECSSGHQWILNQHFDICNIYYAYKENIK